MQSAKPPTPTLDRIYELRDNGQLPAITDFLEWLFDVKDYSLGEYCEHDSGPWGNEFVPVHVGIRTLLADFFKIDLAEEEAERAALLKWVREQQE